MILLKKYALLALTCFLLTSCFEDNDDNGVTTTDINDFVWKGLNTWYFWQGQVDDLADDKFANDAEYTAYLNSFNSPEALFNNLLFNEDRFSWIVDDYFELTNSLNGVFKTNGVEYGLVRVNGGPDVVGYVQYILPNTDAASKNINRGDLFLTVNGIQLTETNFQGLLDSDNYTLGMATLNNGNLETTGETIDLTKQVYTENPVYITKTFEVDDKKVGYLMYNRFTADFDTQLNNAFAEFSAFDVDELVLDLRYNLGGSVNSAIHLSSMITDETGNLFLKQRWNDKIQSALTEEQITRNFTNVLSNGNPINTLDLDKVYVLAQGSSASASELVINSLAPYIEVIHIGEDTRGKNEFSITLYDIPSCGYVRGESCDDAPNASHTYAMQPLVGRNENAVGFSDFTSGLVPDIVFPEDIENLGVLGEQTEPLLARAIQHLSGNGRMAPPTPATPMDIITTSGYLKPMRDNMYVEPNF